MTMEELRSLERGDIVWHKATGDNYVVLFGCMLSGYIVAVREVRISNPAEWEKVERIPVPDGG